MTGKEIVKALRCCAKGLGHDDACENCVREAAAGKNGGQEGWLST